MNKDGVDQLIKNVLHREVVDQEPAEGVRADLLARAASQPAQDEQVLGTSIPPVVNGLREARPMMGLPCWPEVEDDLMELFGSPQQRLVSVWLLASNTRY